MLSKIRQRAQTALLQSSRVLAAALVIAYGGIARAATSATDSAQASADQLTSILLDCGPVLGGMYVLFLVSRALVSRYKDVHFLAAWLGQGKRLAYVTSGLGIAYAGLSAALAGGSTRAVFAAVFAAVFKLLNPTTPSTSSSDSSAPSTPTTTPPPTAVTTATAPTTPTTPTASAA